MIHKGFVQTVLGPVAPEALGLTLTHEHVLIDMTQGAPNSETLINVNESCRACGHIPEAGWEPGEDGPGTAASWKAKWKEPICLSNRADIDRNWFFYGTYSITSLDDVIDEAMLFKRHGGGCIVDQTSIGISRDPYGLQQVARATGLHIVMCTSYYCQGWHPAHVARLDIEQLCERIVRDVDPGVTGGIQAGIIGEVGLSMEMHPDEEKVLRASVRAQKLTGAVLSIHPGYTAESIWDAVRIVEEEGGDLTRTIICHTDTMLPSRPGPDSYDSAPFLELAKTGVYLGLDCFGFEQGFWQHGKIDIANDSVRLNFITALADAGYASRVLISHDMALQNHQRKYGGHGWQHIPETVTALMRHKGFDTALVQRILVDNPRDALTLV
jgi:phosphotriesterase-related protein